MANLPPAKEQAALLLAEGWKQVDVAEELDRSPVTISRWLKEPEFADRVNALRHDLTAQSVDLLREKVLRNTEIVLEIAERGGEPGVVSSQLKAALWAVEKVIGSPKDTAGGQERARRGVEAKLLRKPEVELQELLERGEKE